MTVNFESVFVTASGLFMPGAPVDNDSLDRFIAPLNGSSARLKKRILNENGIRTRHYAITPDGATVYSTATMAANAVRDCVARSEIRLADLTALCSASSGGDNVLPGFANMVQGELHAQPLHTSSHQGVCASGVAAVQHAAAMVELKKEGHAMVVASEFASRMFKRSRFAPSGYNADFDAHFLRWMLSDGAGACLLSSAPRRDGLSLQLKWVHSRSFSGDLPVCMQVGQSNGGVGKSYLDYPSLGEADAAGAFLLRQDIRLLPHLFELGIHEYVDLIGKGVFTPERIDHFLCHYSSQKFAGVVEELMAKAGLAIPTSKWYSNLTARGNTGAASIFIMLSDFMRERELRAGERILCFVPESGRFTVAFMMLEVVAAAGTSSGSADISPPHSAEQAPPRCRGLLTSLASIWHDFRSRAWRTPLIESIVANRFTADSYRRWMSCWIPQVREGSVWMRRGAGRLDDRYRVLADLIHLHAGEEQLDYGVLFEDYRAAGGTEPDIDKLRRNPGGEALNAYLHAMASRTNPIGLLGAVYIIEGTGQRIIPALLPLLKRQLDLPARVFRFLDYHGANDPHHLTRWLQAVEMALAIDPACEQEIVNVARNTAQLYVLQMEHAL